MDKLFFSDFLLCDICNIIVVSNRACYETHIGWLPILLTHRAAVLLPSSLSFTSFNAPKWLASPQQHGSLVGGRADKLAHHARLVPQSPDSGGYSIRANVRDLNGKVTHPKK